MLARRMMMIEFLFLDCLSREGRSVHEDCAPASLVVVSSIKVSRLHTSPEHHSTPLLLLLHFHEDEETTNILQE
jgi:hypothetical protein